MHHPFARTKLREIGKPYGFCDTNFGTRVHTQKYIR